MTRNHIIWIEIEHFRRDTIWSNIFDESFRIEPLWYEKFHPFPYTFVSFFYPSGDALGNRANLFQHLFSSISSHIHLEIGHIHDVIDTELLEFLISKTFKEIEMF